MDVSGVHVLIFVQETIKTSARSGVHRVVVEASRALAALVKIGFVKWDEIDGQLRYLDKTEIRRLFLGDEIISMLQANRLAHRINYRFGETVQDVEKAWLLFPEIPYHRQNGNETFARICTQCREYGIKVAAIFYDLIPIRDPDYHELSTLHHEYVTELMRCDLLVPISRFAYEDLIEFINSQGAFSGEEVEAIRGLVRPILLGEYREDEEWGKGNGAADNVGERHNIVLLGTIEPRKQQTRFLKVFNDLCETHQELQRYVITVIGSLHPASAPLFHAEMARNHKVKYFAYGSEDVVSQAFRDAAFSAFISRNEGYGLPIVESLRRGVPCLTASFGAMAEVAAGGGCLTVDVSSDEEIAAGILQLTCDHGPVDVLRKDLLNRERRSWEDYAGELLSAMHTVSQREVVDRAGLEGAIQTAYGAPEEGHIDVAGLGIVIRKIFPRFGLNGMGPHDRASGRLVLLLFVHATEEELESITPDMAELFVSADILCLTGDASLDKFRRILHEGTVQRLPTFDCFAMPGNEIPGELVDAVATLIAERRRRLAISHKESLYGRLSRKLKDIQPQVKWKLAIVISTFNRGPFTRLNVGWLLQMLGEVGPQVCLVVVDNASTDETYELLKGYFKEPNFIYICNSANTGMLGNLRICSILELARHVWIIGDDDFIQPGAIGRVMSAIEEHPRLPLLVHNFAVYHRERLLEFDEPSTFWREAVHLAPAPGPSGIRKLNTVAAEHDNLFTAIYPLVFRSDILAACFNYPFNGEPFCSLVESVPTTKFILEALAYCDVWWFSEIGVLGNSHNSWSSYRPRWHLVLMPAVLELARRVGVDEEKLWSWLRVHYGLFQEAIEQARQKGVPISLSAIELQHARMVFGDELEIPAGTLVLEQEAVPVWGYME